MTTTAVAPITPSAAASVAAPAANASSASRYGFGEDGFTFGDFLDIINPLQHIPIVGTIYRAITGDTMEAGAEIAGGALYGGPIGALLSVADVAFAADTGKPIDRTMLSWIGLDGDDAPTAVAQATPTVLPHAGHAQAARTQTPFATPVIPSRAFPAATTRIVPMANYYVQPLPASPPAATGAPRAISPATQTQMPTQADSELPIAPVASSQAPAAPTPTLDGAQALLAALRDSGVDPASAARAAAAYQASVAPIVRQPDPAADAAH